MVDFLGIGAPRSGTTWLYDRLSEHPDFSLPPVKEIHYFDRDRGYPSPNMLSETALRRRIRQRTWRSKAVRDCLQSLRSSGAEGFRWYLKWYFSNYDDAWYLSLFSRMSGIRGEITPAYSILEEKDIAHVRNLLPGVKLIYLLRNPIERSWSSYRKQYLRNGTALPDERQMITYLEEPKIVRRTDYLGTLHRYLKYFSSEQILVGTYDAVVHQPRNLLIDIVTYLGGDPALVDAHCAVASVSNAAPPMAIPDGVHACLVDKYRPLITALSERYGEPFDAWLDPCSAHGSTWTPATFHP